MNLRRIGFSLGTCLLAVFSLSSEATQAHLEHKLCNSRTRIREILVRNLPRPMVHLDPQTETMHGTPALFYDLLEGLVSFAPNGELLPGVAECWESDGDKVWTFHLRKDATWSNGDPVTAEDFVLSYQRLIDPKTDAPFSEFLVHHFIKNAKEIFEGDAEPKTLGVTASSSHVLRIELVEKNPELLNLLAQYYMLPIHCKARERGIAELKPGSHVGNGRYKLALQPTASGGFLLTPNLSHPTTATRKAGFKKISYSVVAPHHQESAFLNDVLDITVPVNFGEYSSIPPSRPHLRAFQYKRPLRILLRSYFHRQPQPVLLFLTLNQVEGPLQDESLRRLVRALIDQNQLIEALGRLVDMERYEDNPILLFDCVLTREGYPSLAPTEEEVAEQKRLSSQAVKQLKAKRFSQKKPLVLTLSVKGCYWALAQHLKIMIERGSMNRIRVMLKPWTSTLR